MKTMKMILLFGSFICFTAACQKNHDLLAENPGAAEGVAADALAKDHTALDRTTGEIVSSRCINPNDFVAGVNNPFFPLTPGTTLHYVTTIVDGSNTIIEHNNFMVTSQTKVILGVTCMVVHDVSTIDGRLLEDTYDWFAQDDDGNVWYFGEDTKKYDETGNYSTAGSFEAGVDGAKAGYQMLAKPRTHIGETYRQEYYVGIAEDKAKVINGHVSVSVPYGTFSNCIKTKEWTPLEPGKIGYKIYKAGIGQVYSATPVENESSVLISITN